jgi:hypothetical protein
VFRTAEHVSPTSPSLPFPHAAKLSNAHPHGQWNARPTRAKVNIVARWISDVPVSSKLVLAEPQAFYLARFPFHLGVSDHTVRPTSSSCETVDRF